MKSRTISRFMLAIASSDLTDAELRELEKWLQNTPHVLSRQVKALREQAGRLASPSGEHDPEDNTSNNPDRDPLVERLDQLLRREAGLNATRAADLLAERIHEEYRDLSIPSLGKESFQRWLRLLLEEVPATSLLHFATQIRNSAVHAPMSDWPLKAR